LVFVAGSTVLTVADLAPGNYSLTAETSKIEINTTACPRWSGGSTCHCQSGMDWLGILPGKMRQDFSRPIKWLKVNDFRDMAAISHPL
jgi:hypothetical protein